MGHFHRFYTPDALQQLARALVDDPAKELSGDDKWYLWATVAEGRVEFTLQQIAAIGKIKTGVDRDRVYTPDALQQLARALVDDPGKELSWEDKWYKMKKATQHARHRHMYPKRSQRIYQKLYNGIKKKVAGVKK